MKRMAVSVAIMMCCIGVAMPQIFFKVTGNGLEKPSYIFGSHHMAPLSIKDSVGVDAVLSEVEAVIGEVEMSDNGFDVARKMQKYMIAPPDSTLDKVLSSEQLSRLIERYKEISGLSEFPDLLLMFKPTALGSSLTILIESDLLDFDADNQLDRYFQNYATTHGLKVKGLETVEEQAEAMFNSASIAEQAQELMEMIDNPQEMIKEALKLNEAYMRQDKKVFEELYEEGASEYKHQLQKLLINRNKNWLLLLPDMLREEPSLLVVGYMHLVGSEGLLNKLSASGFEVEPIGWESTAKAE